MGYWFFMHALSGFLGGRLLMQMLSAVRERMVILAEVR